MSLSAAERKHRLPHGAQLEIAGDEGVSKSYVSLMMDGKIRPQTKDAKLRLRGIQRRVARRYFKLPVEEVFPPEEEAMAIGVSGVS